jgi:hypothetical protein
MYTLCLCGEMVQQQALLTPLAVFKRCAQQREATVDTASAGEDIYIQE